MGGIQWTNLAGDLNSGWLWHFCCSNWVESSHGENCKDANFGQFPHLLQFNWEVNKIIFLYFVIASWSVGSKVQPWIKYRCKLSHIPSCPTGQNNVIQCTDFFYSNWNLLKVDQNSDWENGVGGGWTNWNSITSPSLSWRNWGPFYKSSNGVLKCDSSWQAYSNQ